MKHVGNLQYITFLKGLAILGVILVHAPQLIKEINPLIREFLHAGAFGCQLFFVISGFLAVKSWERLLAKYENSTEKNRTTYKTFLKKRYLSIAPIYILFILFYQIISYYIATFNVEPFYKISHNPLSILANTFWEWLEIYPIMLVSYFFIKKSVWIKRICTFMGQISLESYLTNGCMILLIGLLPWETTLDHLNYGNYLRYTLIIVTGITTAYCANRIINKITARL